MGAKYRLCLGPMCHKVLEDTDTALGFVVSRVSLGHALQARPHKQVSPHPR